MELDIWKGDWGLASIDLNSLRISAYIKFLGAPVLFNEKTNPFKLGHGEFPIFRHGKKKLSQFEDVITYLKSQNFDADQHLSEEQKATAQAFTHYLQLKLYPCLQYIWWADVTNSGQEMRTWFSKNIPFPFNYYYPGKYEERAKDLIETLFDDSYEPKEIHCELYQAAEKCFSDLSAKLGDNEFMFGKNPSSLDATVFAYIALILRIPQKNATLLNTLKTHYNLTQFANRISQRYFTMINNEFTSKQSKKATGTQDGEKTIRQARNKIFAGLFAGIAMACYAVSTGILKINFKEEFQNSLDYNEYFEAEEEN